MLENDRSPTADEAELIHFSASILDDGEVTEDEAYRLAEWLNNHRAIAESFLGNQLVRPLQEIWADGSANVRELHRLKRLLVSIQREWAKRGVRRSSSEKVFVEESVAGNIHSVRLPSLSVTMHVPSRTTPGLIYDVDLTGPSCSCPDWRGARCLLPVGHFSRCCKHIFDAYAAVPRRTGADGWLLAFVDYGWPSHPKAEWELLSMAVAPVLFCTAVDGGWANVFAKDGVTYMRFGFHPGEDRWAYNMKPQDAAAIANAVSLKSGC